MRRQHLFLMLLVFLLDQGSKFWVLSQRGSLPLEVVPFFNLVLTWNRGVSFGFLNQGGDLIFWILTFIAIGIVLGMLVHMYRRPSKRRDLFFSLIIGGALGNIFDRLWHGGVVDFLDFHIYNYHWPAFNIADAAVVMGVGFLIFDMYWCEKK